MKARFQIWSIVLIAAVSGCAAKVKSIRPDPSISTAELRLLAIVPLNLTGSTTLSGAAGGSIASASLTDGQKQTLISVSQLRFELESRGFTTVTDTAKAIWPRGAIAEFSIGQVRYDALVGWIADEAILRIRQQNNEESIAVIRADSRGITPTTGSLIRALSNSAQKTIRPNQ